MLQETFERMKKEIYTQLTKELKSELCKLTTSRECLELYEQSIRSGSMSIVEPRYMFERDNYISHTAKRDTMLWVGNALYDIFEHADTL